MNSSIISLATFSRSNLVNLRPTTLPIIVGYTVLNKTEHVEKPSSLIPTYKVPPSEFRNAEPYF